MSAVGHPQYERDMLKEYKAKTNYGIGIGIMLQIVSFVLIDTYRGTGEPIFALLVFLTGYVFFIWGCMSYSKGKGHHPAWGLFGLLSFVGMIVLVFFTDRHKKLTDA